MALNSKEYQKQWRLANPEKVKASAKKYREANKELTAIRSKLYNENNPNKVKCNHYKNRYGISLEGATELLIQQGGVCAVCDKPLDFSLGKKGRDKPVVDHCHITNKVRGILCTNCNLMLGYSLDRILTLQQAIQYLENSN